MQKITLTTLTLLSASLFIGGCLFPSFDDMKGDGPAKDGDPTSESNATSATNAASTTTNADGGADAASSPNANPSSTPAQTPDPNVDAGPRPVASVKCGGTGGSCSGATQYCCGTDGFGAFCKDNGKEATDCKGGDLALHCDDKADCQSNEVCCLDTAKNSSSCATSCGAANKLLCRANSDCPTGKACTGVIDHLWGAVTSFCQ